MLQIPREVPGVKFTLVATLYVSCILLPTVVMIPGGVCYFTNPVHWRIKYSLFATDVCDAAAVLSSGAYSSFSALIG